MARMAWRRKSALMRLAAGVRGFKGWDRRFVCGTEGVAVFKIKSGDRPSVDESILVNPLSLPRISYAECTKHLPEASGVYFLIHKETILYIGGSATNLKTRHSFHESLNRFWGIKKLKGVEIAWVLTVDCNTKNIEYAYIQKHKPMLNCSGAGGGRSRAIAVTEWEDYLDRQLNIN